MKKVMGKPVRIPVKKMTILLAAFFLILSTGLSACSKETETEIKISLDEGVIHAKNSTLELELTGTPSTGYEWTVDVENEDLLKQTDFTTEEVKNTESGEELVGAPSIFRYTFEASGDGKTELTLKYARSWETTPDDIEYTYTVTVNKGKIMGIE